MTRLPLPVARFAELATSAWPGPMETAIIETSGWMRRPPLPPIPLEIRMSHVLGRAFAHDIRIGRGRLSVRFGLDAYVDGRGLMKVGPSVQTGLEFDQGALIAMWGEALVFPVAWLKRTDIRWEPVDAGSARLVVAGPEGDLPITVRFDAGTGLPTSCEADRYKATGPKVRWSGHFADWHRTADGLLVPRTQRVLWSDEKRPWLELRTRAVRVNVPVDASLTRAWRALTAADEAQAVVHSSPS